MPTQKKKLTFDEWYAKYGDGLPFTPESSYSKHRRHPVKRVSGLMRDFDFDEGHFPCVMLGSGHFRSWKYGGKCHYSEHVLARFIRMKAITIIHAEDAESLYKFVFSKRRPSWHNFSHLHSMFRFFPMRSKDFIFGAHVCGVRIDVLSNEQVAHIEKLRAVGEKIDRIFTQIDKNAGEQR